MIVGNLELDMLIEKYRQRAKSKHSRITEYGREQYRETIAALEELKALRAAQVEIRCEGTVR